MPCILIFALSCQVAKLFERPRSWFNLFFFPSSVSISITFVQQIHKVVCSSYKYPHPPNPSPFCKQLPQPIIIQDSVKWQKYVRSLSVLMAIFQVNLGLITLENFLHAEKNRTTKLISRFVKYRRTIFIGRQWWHSEEDDRQVATCPQLGSTNRLKHAQVRLGTHSFPVKSATLAGRCRPGSV